MWLLGRGIMGGVPADAEKVPLTIPQSVVKAATQFMHRTVSFWGHHDQLTKGELSILEASCTPSFTILPSRSIKPASPA